MTNKGTDYIREKRLSVGFLFQYFVFVPSLFKKQVLLCHAPKAFRATMASAFSGIPKIIFDMGKTVSYAGKIMSDIIQTTSDLF